MERLFFIMLIFLFIVSCTQKKERFHIDTSPDQESEMETDSVIPQDTGTETTPADTISDSDSDTFPAQETDSGSDSAEQTTDTDSEIPLGRLRDPCWIPVLTSDHPNAGLPDCEEGLHCVGDSDEAWCTETCLDTGSISNILGIEGWCCGEVGSACDPTGYFMPETMAVNCAPRTIELGETCESSGELRCAAVCSGTDVVYNVVCVQIEGGGFCSFPCESDSDCTNTVEFENGCCGTAMSGNYCLAAVSDRCLP